MPSVILLKSSNSRAGTEMMIWRHRSHHPHMGIGRLLFHASSLQRNDGPEKPSRQWTRTRRLVVGRRRPASLMLDPWNTRRTRNVPPAEFVGYGMSATRITSRNPRKTATGLPRDESSVEGCRKLSPTEHGSVNAHGRQRRWRAIETIRDEAPLWGTRHQQKLPVSSPSP